MAMAVLPLTMHCWHDQEVPEDRPTDRTNAVDHDYTTPCKRRTAKYLKLEILPKHLQISKYRYRENGKDPELRKLRGAYDHRANPKVERSDLVRDQFSIQ